MRPVSEISKQVLQNYLMPDAFQWRLRRGAHCALTFDDGPHEEYTPRVLEVLAQYRVKATFFVVGESAEKAPQLLRQIVAEGHGIASHTFSHRDLPTLSRKELWDELTRCRKTIADLTGIDTALVRPPRGKLSLAALLRMRHWGYRVIHWSKTYSDYLKDGSDALLGRIRATGLDACDIALFHDNNSHTVEALAEILPEWTGRGRSFVSLQ